MATSRFRFSPSCAHPNPRPTSHAPTPLLAPLTPLRVPLPLANHSEPKVFEVTVNNTFSGAITQHIPNGLAGIHDSVQATILGHVGSIAEQAIRPGRAAGGSAQSLTLPSHTEEARGGGSCAARLLCLTDARATCGVLPACAVAGEPGRSQGRPGQD